MITLTENAITEIKRILSEEKTDAYFRVSIRGGGCVGFKWNLELDPNFDQEKDHLFEQDGIKIIVDNRSAVHIEGTTIDYLKDLNHHGFSCKNDKIKGTCGCGSSFSM